MKSERFTTQDLQHTTTGTCTVWQCFLQLVESKHTTFSQILKVHIQILLPHLAIIENYYHTHK